MNNKDLLKKLTLAEKVKWTSGNTLWTMIGSERLGINEIIVADGPHGVRAYKEKPGNGLLDDDIMAPSTMFPSAAGMASTFNESLLYNIGKAIGDECNHYSVDVLLAPGMNLKRSPLAGRNFEYYSEDPFLTTKCATNFINGVQSTGVSACAKHFALNEQENQRRFLNTICDERTMHEYYLRPFQDVLKASNPHTVMSSYNRVNGEYASESSYLLKDVLRTKWQYDGAVISDWGAAQNRVKSIKNGLNVEMPGPSEFINEVTDALQSGELTESDIDESLLPLLKLRDRINLNDKKGQKVDLNVGHKLAQDVSREAIVLLENDGLLPLKKNIKIGVIGAFAKKPRMNGGGSATLKPFITENPLQELKNEFTVDYCEGYMEENTNSELLQEVQTVVANNEIVLYFTGTTENLETEGKEREHMSLPKGHITVFNEIKKYGKQVIVILNNGGPLDLTVLEGNISALIEAWFLGSANAKALVEIITGDTNPSGRLSETIPLCIEHTPHYGIFPAKEDDVNYSGDIIRNGYRYYDTHKYPVRYPFGYGLSYATFEYSNLVLDKKVLLDDEVLTVQVTIKNTSEFIGKEVIQLYVHDQESYYPRPFKELKAFTKIELSPNEEKVVSFTLDENAFNIYSVDFKDFRVESGLFTIMIGKNAMNIVLEADVEYITEKPLKKNLTLNHPLKNFKLYKYELYKIIEDEFRVFPWYEIEEPAIRVLKRLKREHNLTNDKLEEMKQILLK